MVAQIHKSRISRIRRQVSWANTASVCKFGLIIDGNSRKIVGIGVIFDLLRGMPSTCSTAAGKASLCTPSTKIQFFDRFVRRAPGFRLPRCNRVLDTVNELLKIILQLEIQPVRERGDTGVIAMVAPHPGAPGSLSGKASTSQI